MVHGDMSQEIQVLEQEVAVAPEFLSLYLGDGPLNLTELGWLHERRLRDIQLADRVIVPSDYIARVLVARGIASHKIAVIPYAADCQRFQPLAGKGHNPGCTFIFAGGITQRKGIKYLLNAWDRIRQPGWKLQLLGALPQNLGPLVRMLDHVEVLGKVPHSQVPNYMAAADVFVFPSLFEGSAVVTYEALACGLPCIVSSEAGSVVRDGVEGFIIKARDVNDLAKRMDKLGRAPQLRARMSSAARLRALEFDWCRYHKAVVNELRSLIQHDPAQASQPSAHPSLTLEASLTVKAS
jgi:glycosyltransferase involved in cell wall biosynthesis